jgi:hypothetical protein
MKKKKKNPKAFLFSARERTAKDTYLTEMNKSFARHEHIGLGNIKQYRKRLALFIYQRKIKQLRHFSCVRFVCFFSL